MPHSSKPQRYYLLAVIVALVATIPLPAFAATSTARGLALKLETKAENGAGYARAAFTHWTDDDKDGCDTRKEVLITESKRKPTIGASCRVTAGKWVSWYDNKTWTNPADVDIDHVVALKEAWDSGARSWTTADRTRYANDLGYAWTLDAITDNVNSSKSDRDPAQWLPPVAATHCAYAKHWVAVKYRWRLTVDAKEKTKLLRILSGSCGSKTLTVPARAIAQPTATDTTSTTPPPTTTTVQTPAPAPTTSPTTTPAPTPPTSTCCKICTTGKACGDSCISKSYTCHKPPGCAC